MHGSQYMRRPEGIALVQVLVIVAILMVMGVSFINETRDNIQIATWNNDRLAAQVANKDMESALLYELITIDRSVDGVPSGTSPLSQRWNFWGDYFDASQITRVAIQDQSSLLHVHYPEPEYFTQLAVGLGYSPDEAAGLLDELLDWQDLDDTPRNNGAEQSQYGAEAIRNGAVQSVTDLRFLPSLKPETASEMLSQLTLFRRGGLNIFNANETLIAALTNPTAAAQVTALRATREIDAASFQRITGIEESFSVVFANTNFLAITFESLVGESLAVSHIVLQLDTKAEGAKPPFIIFKQRL